MLRTEWVGCYAKSEHGVGVRVTVKYDATQIVSTVLRSVSGKYGKYIYINSYRKVGTILYVETKSVNLLYTR